MLGAIPPLPNTPLWRDAQLKHRDNFTCTLVVMLLYVPVYEYSEISILRSGSTHSQMFSFLGVRN
jgi:hypothetical protein